MFLTYYFDLPWRRPFINVSKVLLHATGDPMTQDRHYSDHPSHYVSPRPRIETGLTACEASMLPTTPPGGCMLIGNHCLSPISFFSVFPIQIKIVTKCNKGSKDFCTNWEKSLNIKIFNPQWKQILEFASKQLKITPSFGCNIES